MGTAISISLRCVKSCLPSSRGGVGEKKIKKIVEAFVRVGTQKSPSAAQLDAER